jgi:hypothetical protein
VNESELPGATALDVAIDGVVASVEFSAAEPTARDACRRVEYFPGRYDPIDSARGLLPERIRIASAQLHGFEVA